MTAFSSASGAASGVATDRVLHHGEGHRHLALELIGDADHRAPRRWRRCGSDRLLDLAGAQAVAGDVDDVVGAAEDEVVAVLVADAPVEGGIDLLAGKEVK
jgi:hypothetical protein